MQLPPAENNLTMSLTGYSKPASCCCHRFLYNPIPVKNYKRIYAALYSYLSAFLAGFTNGAQPSRAILTSRNPC